MNVDCEGLEYVGVEVYGLPMLRSTNELESISVYARDALLFLRILIDYPVSIILVLRSTCAVVAKIKFPKLHHRTVFVPGDC